MADTQAATPQENEVKTAMQNFQVALQAMFQGELGPMMEVWSHAGDVSYMGPYGGIQRGWEQVRENLQRQANKKPNGHVMYENMQISAGRDVAVVGSQIVGETFVNGDRIPVSIRATSTFRKEEGRWKMIGHHTDML